jgi:hypothetical protein
MSSGRPQAQTPRSVVRPAGHQLPQRKFEGILRKTQRSAIITFELTVFRLVKLKFLVVVPEEGQTRAPVYVRFWVDPEQGDAPGATMEGGDGDG